MDQPAQPALVTISTPNQMVFIIKSYSTRYGNTCGKIKRANVVFLNKVNDQNNPFTK